MSFSFLWPDPDSCVLAKIEFGVDVSLLLEWLEIRDTLLGENKRKLDVQMALQLAQESRHPDAVWLTSIFKGRDVSTKEEARGVFLELEADDSRALCFAWCLTEGRWSDVCALKRAMELGNSFAAAKLSLHASSVGWQQMFALAHRSAHKNERDGFFSMGLCLENGWGCETDLEKAKECYLIAAELGDIFAADMYSCLLNESHVGRWIWQGRAMSRGYEPSFSFLHTFAAQVGIFLSGSENRCIVFAIGLAFKGHIDTEKKQIFGDSFNFDSNVHAATQAVSFFDSQMQSARLAVKTWTLIALRLSITKDIRTLIGQMIWDAKVEANYKS